MLRDTAYGWEAEESRCDRHRLTEKDRYLAVNESRWSLGIVGDPEDAIYG